MLSAEDKESVSGDLPDESVNFRQILPGKDIRELAASIEHVLKHVQASGGDEQRQAVFVAHYLAPRIAELQHALPDAERFRTLTEQRCPVGAHTGWYAPSNGVQHRCPWCQILELGGYALASDAPPPVPPVEDPERCPAGDPECDSEIVHDGCRTPGGSVPSASATEYAEALAGLLPTTEDRVELSAAWDRLERARRAVAHEAIVEGRDIAADSVKGYTGNAAFPPLTVSDIEDDDADSDGVR